MLKLKDFRQNVYDYIKKEITNKLIHSSNQNIFFLQAQLAINILPYYRHSIASSIQFALYCFNFPYSSSRLNLFHILAFVILFSFVYLNLQRLFISYFRSPSFYAFVDVLSLIHISNNQNLHGNVGYTVNIILSK